MMNLTFIQIIIIGLIYFGGNSTAWTFGVGYYTLYRPVISGLLVGCLLKNPIAGMLAGAVVNIVYLDFVSTGGSLKGDPCLTGIIAALSVIMYKLNPIEAAAISYPIGLIGIILWKYRLSINSKFVLRADRNIEQGKISGVVTNNIIYPQFILLILSVITILFTGYILKFIIGFLNNYFYTYNELLYMMGILLIAFSVAVKMNQINNKLSIICFIVVYWIFYFLNINPVIIIFLALIIISILIILKERLDNNEK